MKRTLTSSDVVIYTGRATTTLIGIQSYPGNPTNKGAQVSTTSDTFTNIRVDRETLTATHIRKYTYVPGEFRMPQS